jgi:hypothetical protein
LEASEQSVGEVARHHPGDQLLRREQQGGGQSPQRGHPLGIPRSGWNVSKFQITGDHRAGDELIPTRVVDRVGVDLVAAHPPDRLDPDPSLRAFRDLLGEVENLLGVGAPRTPLRPHREHDRATAPPRLVRRSHGIVHRGGCVGSRAGSEQRHDEDRRAPGRHASHHTLLHEDAVDATHPTCLAAPSSLQHRAPRGLWPATVRASQMLGAARKRAKPVAAMVVLSSQRDRHESDCTFMLPLRWNSSRKEHG